MNPILRIKARTKAPKSAPLNSAQNLSIIQNNRDLANRHAATQIIRLQKAAEEEVRIRVELARQEAIDKANNAKRKR